MLELNKHSLSGTDQKNGDFFLGKDKGDATYDQSLQNYEPTWVGASGMSPSQKKYPQVFHAQ